MDKKIIQEERNLSLFDIFSLGFGGAVGSGIFVLMGLGIDYTGRSIVLAVIFGCLVMLLAYFYNVLLSSMFMLRGGDYSQKSIAFNPFFTGVNGYITFINGFAVAMYSVAMVEYASIVFPGILAYKKLIAIVIVTLFFAATIKGSKFISMVNSFMTTVLIVSIVLFIVMGLPKIKAGFFTGDDFFRNGTIGFVQAIAIMGWACQGTTMGPVSVSAVAKNPKRNIPKGILLVTIVLAVVYGLMSTVASGVLPVEEVAKQNLSAVAKEIFPYWIFVLFIIGGAVFAIGTSMITGIIMVRYPILKVAEDGWLPKVFTKTTKTGYPYMVYAIYYILAIVPVISGLSLNAIVSLVMIPTMIMNMYCNLSCIKIMKDYKEQWRKSILHMPDIIMNIICVLAAAAAGVVCYNLFKTLSRNEQYVMLAILAIISLLSFYSIKSGNVHKERLADSKDFIIKEALEWERENQ